MEYRLKRQCDFDLVFQKGKKAYTKTLAMYYIERNSGNVKIGISVSKKHGNAVKRNRIKRLLRAAYLPIVKDIKKNAFIVFIPRVREVYEYQEINQSVDFLLKKENLL